MLDQLVSDDAATVTFVLFCVAGMLFLIQGIAFFYAGLTSFSSALVQASYSMIALSICLLQFFVMGSSLINTTSGGGLGWFVGNLSDAFMIQMPKPDDPHIVSYISKALLNAGFSSVACSLMIGATTQRGRLLPSLVFVVVWLTLIYDPIAHWCWSSEGWSFRIGALDYAGGTAVHVTAGVSALVYSAMLGPRTQTESVSQQPVSLLLVVLGTFMMWVGWFGFNCGAALEPTIKSLHTLLNTQISASAGGLTWMLLDHSFDGEWSIVGFCSGVVAGLVCVTPGAAYIPVWAACFFGIIGALTCNFGTNLKFQFGADDALDIFAVHGVGGFTGSILTGVFADPSWSRNKGALYGNYWQVVIQLVSACAIALYTAAGTFVTLSIIDHLPEMHLRLSPDLERIGLDLVEHGETVANTGELQSVSADGSYRPRSDSGANKYRQTNMNVSMFPDPAEFPLLHQRPSIKYGTANTGPY